MEEISRTQKKKNAQTLQKLGEQLLGLSEEKVATLNLDPELEEALSMARHMTKHEARRRQLQYIGRLMRGIDPARVEEAFQRVHSQEDHKARAFKLVEQWRDELVAGNDERRQWLTVQFPDMDIQQLTKLVQHAQVANNTPKARQESRQLFRFLARLVPDDPV
jgi:ribosome-associated protein